jgi:hypothetical protein
MRFSSVFPSATSIYRMKKAEIQDVLFNYGREIPLDIDNAKLITGKLPEQQTNYAWLLLDVRSRCFFS